MSSGHKTIAVHVNESKQAFERIQLAANLAVRFDAHLIGVAAFGIPITYYMPVLAGDVGGMIPEYEDMLQERADSALALFESLADKGNVKYFEKRVYSADSDTALTLQARSSDLLIVGQEDPDDASTIMSPTSIDYVFLHSVCPVLVLPYRQKVSDAGKRVLIAWNGSAAASRAATGAITFLKDADISEVAIIGAEKSSMINGESAQADIARFLSRHDAKVDIYQEEQGRHANTAEALMARASEIEADLLVMGGYGHSRFREVVLGGTTRRLLKSMTTPILICH